MRTKTNSEDEGEAGEAVDAAEDKGVAVDDLGDSSGLAGVVEGLVAALVASVGEAGHEAGDGA
jgi:hypothetical protein